MGILDRFRDLRGRGREDSFFGKEEAAIDRIPYHVAIIMDGNGRWAASRRLPVLMGHREGTRALKRTIEAALEVGIRQLTVYSFSTENWNRSEEEVRGLLDLLREMIATEVPDLHEQGVRVLFIGRRTELGDELRREMMEAETRTAQNEIMTLFVAFNYGGRAEIVDACRSILEESVSHDGPPEDLVTERAVTEHLYAPEMQEPDLVIRTSGERRLSNFLLWESAYSELYFSKALWPDFGRDELRRALWDYASRERRFGERRAEDLA